MSDPASQADSDAVLASIRRLVLDGQGDRRVARDAPRDDPSKPLVLTAAQRVDAGAAGDGAAHRGDAAKGAALDWQDAAATGGEDAPRDLRVAHDAPDLPEAVVDEDFLRDIVSEIVREELQGDMGARITRNVRKLVRREIHRALASRDID